MAENRGRSSAPYQDLRSDAGRVNFHRLFNTEQATMAGRQRSRSSSVRAAAISAFKNYYGEVHYDPLIPYMAVTLVDRVLSKDPMPKVLDHAANNEKLFLTCCLILSWKIRTDEFEAAEFLERNNLDFTGEQLVEMESSIGRVLEWRLMTVMPFRFIHLFASFVTLPRPPPPSALRPVYKLLIKSQCDSAFTKFRPSIMAASAMRIFVSNEYPNQLRDLESNLIRGFFHPRHEGEFKKCIEKLTPLYGGVTNVTEHPAAAIGPTGTSLTSFAPAPPALVDIGLLDIELDWSAAENTPLPSPSIPKCCKIL